MSRCEPPDATREGTYWLLHPDGSSKVGVWRPPAGPLSAGAWDAGGSVASCDLWTRYGWTCGPAVPTPEELAALLKAARKLDHFAWSALTPDCKEAGDYMNSLVAALRAALAAPSFGESGDGE